MAIAQNLAPSPQSLAKIKAAVAAVVASGKPVTPEAVIARFTSDPVKQAHILNVHVKGLISGQGTPAFKAVVASVTKKIQAR